METCDHASCDITSVEEGSLSEKLQHLHLLVETQQQDLMAVENLILETPVNMAVAKETVKRSVDVLDTDQTSVAVPAAKA